MRIADLDRFNALVTIDMHAHFAVLAEQARLKAERTEFLAQQGKLPPHKRATQYAVAEGAQEQQTDSEGLDNAGIHLDEHAHEYAAAPHESAWGRGVAEGGRVKENKNSDSMSDLEQHKGIYARLGSLGPHRHAARAARALNCDESDDECMDSPSKGVRRLFDSKTQPMELQV